MPWLWLLSMGLVGERKEEGKKSYHAKAKRKFCFQWQNTEICNDCNSSTTPLKSRTTLLRTTCTYWVQISMPISWCKKFLVWKLTIKQTFCMKSKSKQLNTTGGSSEVVTFPSSCSSKTTWSYGMRGRERECVCVSANHNIYLSCNGKYVRYVMNIPVDGLEPVLYYLCQ